MIAELSLVDSEETLIIDQTNSRTAPMQHHPSLSSFTLPFSSHNPTHDLLHLTPSAHLHPSILYPSTLPDPTRLISFSPSRTFNSLPKSSTTISPLLNHITTIAPHLKHHRSYLPVNILLPDSPLNSDPVSPFHNVNH